MAFGEAWRAKAALARPSVKIDGGYVVRRNASRRHMTKGQLAMVAVKSESLESKGSELMSV